MQVVITLAGLGTRFTDKGHRTPKPMIEVAERPAIVFLIKSFSKNWSLFFVLGEHYKNLGLEALILQMLPTSKIIYTAYSARGPIDTVKAALPFLQADKPVMTSYCDLALVWNPEDFNQAVQDYDMAVVNYQGFHPTYYGPNSYCHVQVNSKNHEVLYLQEKKLFTSELQTEITSAGIYYFKTAALLSAALAAQLQQNLKYGNEFYISLAIQALLYESKKYRVLDYRVENVVQLGTPADIERFQYWYDLVVLKKPTEDLKIENFELEKNYWDKIFTSALF